MFVNFALNLGVKGWFISHVLRLFQMIETNDISEEKIKMKQTMEGTKFYCFVLEQRVPVTRVPSSHSLLLQGRLCGRALESHFISQILLDDICRPAFFPL